MKFHFRLFPILVSTFFLLVLLIGCGGGGGAGGGDNEASKEDITADIVMPDSTKVLTEITLEHLSKVSADGYTFTFDKSTEQLDAISEDDVIVFGVTNLTPYGALRKVSSIVVNGSEIIVETTLATLEDAIQEGTISVSKKLSPDDITTAIALKRGVTFLPSAHLEDTFTFGLDGAILYDKDGKQIVANGQVSFPISFDFNVNVSWFKIKYLQFKAKIGDMESELANLEISSQVNISKQKEYEIAKINFPPITASIIVLTPVLTVNVGVSGNVTAGISTGVSTKAEFEAGLIYDKTASEKWSIVKEEKPTIEYELQPPTFDVGCYAKAYASPSLDLLIYGMAGPNIAVEGYFELIVGGTNIAKAMNENKNKACPDDNTSSWAICGGLNVNAGVKFTGFSWLLDDYTTEPPIYSIRKTVYESGTAPDTKPIPKISQPKGSVVRIVEGDSLDFQGTVEKGNPPFTYQWDFGGGASDLSAEDLKKKDPGEVFFRTAGTYEITFKVSEADNPDVWYGDVIQIQVAIPLTAKIISPDENLTIAQGGSCRFDGSHSGGKDPATYLWDFGGGAPDLQPEYLIVPNIGLIQFSKAGVYTVTFKVTDALNDSDTTTRIITVEAIDDFDDYVQDILNATNYNNPSLEVGRISKDYLDDGINYDDVVQDVDYLYSNFTVSASTYKINEVSSNDGTNAVINRTRSWRLTDKDTGCIYDESWTGDKHLKFEDNKWKDFGNQKSDERDPSIVQAVTCESIRYTYQFGANEACGIGPGNIVSEFSGFAGQDEPMYVFVGLKDLKGMVPLKMDWIDPYGNIFYSHKVDLLGGEFYYRSYDEYSYVWVDENYANLFAGQWKVEIYVSGVLLKTVEFTYSP